MNLRLLIMAIAMTSAIFFPGSGEAQIKTLVMPGQLIADHAEFEPDCASCHKNFDKPAQRQLCLDCHEDVATDYATGSGFHGLFPDAQDVQCAVCHADHLGRNADIVRLNKSSFDHRYTDFELLGSHTKAACTACHSIDLLYRDAPGECDDCHSEDNVHGQTFATSCEDCHQSTAWPDASFDHDTTDYPLLGKHINAACLDCHADSTYQSTPATCFGCHAEDDAHNGRSGEQCETCHNPTDWHDSSFDHARDTEFALEGRHATLTCNDCHSENPFEDTMDMACVACHLEDDSHEGHNGEQCASCHNSKDWAESQFDHDRDTGYRLLGAHEVAACNDCHVEPIFEVALQTSCDSCHLEDDAHDRALGTQCANCHTEFDWHDPVFFDHDLASFALLGAHRDVECDDCHATQLFTDTGSACIDCHLEDDHHRGVFEQNCEACHNPVAWDLWLFEHNTQTDFELHGAHAEVACESCHRKSLAAMRKTGERCADCHLADDVHDGEFGPDCSRCHSDISFQDVRSLQ